MKIDQGMRRNELEKEEERFRQAVSHLALEKLILKEAAAGKAVTPRSSSPMLRSRQRVTKRAASLAELGDATGARSGPLAKIARYYRAHLALPAISPLAVAFAVMMRRYGSVNPAAIAS